MHVTHSERPAITTHGALGFTFRHKEWRDLVLATGASGRRSGQRH